MSLMDRLLDQLKQRGLSVGPGAKPGELVLRGPASERTPELMKALKAFRPQMLAKFGKTETVNGTETPARQTEPEAQPEPEPELCPECNRDVTDPEDRERLKWPNPWCDRGKSKGVTDGNGVYHPPQPGCPYRG